MKNSTGTDTILPKYLVGRLLVSSMLVALAVSWALPCHAQDDAAALKLGVLLEKFERQKVATMEPLEKFDNRYAEELAKLQQKAQQAGDLELVLAAKEEADAFRDREDEDPERSKHTELANLQSIYAKQSLQLEEKQKRALSKLLVEQRDQLKQWVTDLTKARELELAVEVRKEIEKLDAIILEDSATVRGRYVRVELPRSGVLSLSEVQVMSGGENIAVKGKASQSSTAGYSADPYAKKAIDGNTDGDFNEGKSTTHTNPEKNPWWEVDLGEERGLNQVVIWNRAGLQERLDGFMVSILDVDRNTVWTKTFKKAPERELEIDLGSERKR